MKYAVIGFGAVGQAAAKTFARKGLTVAIASRRAPEELKPEAQAIGSSVVPVTIKEAVQADVVLLAIPYSQHQQTADAAESWAGKLVIDATNAYGTPLSDFGGLSAAAYAAKKYPGARYVKGFNHLPANQLAADPAINGGRRVIFISSDDDAALAQASELFQQLGYAPVSLGTFAESGPMTSARGRSWSPLNFQDLVKFDNK